jgi:hypothetical protein
MIDQSEPTNEIKFRKKKKEKEEGWKNVGIPKYLIFESIKPQKFFFSF